MRFAICVLLAIAASTASAAALSPRRQFEAFKAQHKKSYASAKEEATRFGIFYANLKRIRALSESNPSATFGVTKFADLSEAEFLALHRPMRQSASDIKGKDNNNMIRPGGTSLPTKVDWQARGAVTPVQDNSDGGAAFVNAVTGTLEGQWFIAGYTMQPLSTAELADCDPTAKEGGTPVTSMQWILSNQTGRVLTAASYPDNGSGVCQWGLLNNTADVGAVLYNYLVIPQDSEMTTLRQTVAQNGPVAVGVDASSWQLYTGGVMTNCNCTTLDNAVLLTGYDMSAPVPYWRLRNEWGVDWGEQGYIRLAMGSDQCCVADMASIAVVADPVTTGVPPPAWNTFSQKRCQDSNCAIGCTEISGPLDVCIPPASGVTSPMYATCGVDAGLTLSMFPFAPNGQSCTGQAFQQKSVLGLCVPGTNGDYIFSQCQ